MDGSGAERNRELDTRHVPTPEHPPFPLLQLNPSAMSVVSQRVCSFPPPRVLNTSKSQSRLSSVVRSASRVNFSR